MHSQVQQKQAAGLTQNPEVRETKNAHAAKITGLGAFLTDGRTRYTKDKSMESENEMFIG